MSIWICVDCTDECANSEHAWVKATRITLPNGTDAWLVGPDEPDENEDPNGDDAFAGWIT